MDTVTHTLFGVALYRALGKDFLTPELKRPLLFTALVGSQIPDIDVISQWWDTSGQYLSWHRGITHSVFLVPAWALVISLLCFLIWRTKDKRILLLGMLAVFIHDTSDLFNAWGTGYLEPFSSMRITFGTVPIVSVLVWVIIIGGFIVARAKKNIHPSRVFKTVWLLIAAHFVMQSVQGYVVYADAKEKYEQVALSADFWPGSFKVIGKQGDTVEITQASLAGQPRLMYSLPTASKADLSQLFEQNPKAKTLYQWAPFVVVVDEANSLGIYDPRFYSNGQSFLFEKMEKIEKTQP